MKTPKSSPDGMRVKDMTTGEPARLMLAFALPLFIGNIFQQAYNMVDTMVAGYTLGDTAIAAIGPPQPFIILLSTSPSASTAAVPLWSPRALEPTMKRG